MSNRIVKWVAAGVIYLVVVIGAYYVFEDYLVDPEADHDQHAIEMNEYDTTIETNDNKAFYDMS